MKRETQEKLQRKFLALPLHHIDTSIILENETTENGRCCKKYLNIVGSKYRGKFSFPILSEIFVKLLQIENFNEQWNMLSALNMLINHRQIEFYSPRNTSLNEIKISEIDKRIQPLDRHIISCAAEDRATVVTLDPELINNTKIENEFGIKIMHPKDLT